MLSGRKYCPCYRMFVIRFKTSLVAQCRRKSLLSVRRSCVLCSPRTNGIDLSDTSPSLTQSHSKSHVKYVDVLRLRRRKLIIASVPCYSGLQVGEWWICTFVRKVYCCRTDALVQPLTSLIRGYSYHAIFDSD